MKKLVLIFAVLFVAAAAYASTVLTIDPSTMKNGETKTLTEDGTTIKVTRDGDATNIKIDGAGESRTITVTHAGDGDGHISINRDGRRFRVVTPDVVVPPIRIPHLREHHFGTFYVCPKDGASLRVPDDKDGKSEKSYKCPVDGTTMEKKKGRGFMFSFDDDAFSAFDML